MNKWAELILGLILVIIAVAVALNFSGWWIATKEFIQGAIIVVVFLLGLLFLLLGISDMRS